MNKTRAMAEMTLGNIKEYIRQTLSQIESAMRTTNNSLDYIKLIGKVEALTDFGKALDTIDEKYFDVLEQSISEDTDNGQRLVTKSNKEAK